MIKPLGLPAKTLDLPPGKVRPPQARRFRRRFLLGSLLVVVFGFGLAGVSAMNMQRELHALAGAAQNNLTLGIDAFKNERFSHSLSAFGESSRLIGEMRAQLQPYLVSGLASGTALADADALLATAGELADAGASLAQVGDPLKQLPHLLATKQGEAALKVIGSAEGELQKVQASLDRLDAKIKNARSGALASVFASGYEQIAAKLPAAQKAVATMTELTEAVARLVGKDGEHTMLVLLQNSGEIRATGGFPGSLVLVNAKSGVVTPQFQDIYYYAWQNALRLPPPPGFERIAERLNLHDANYSFDFPASAARLRELLQGSTGPEAQTVVVITDRLIEEILAETGPLAVPGTDQKLSAENLPMLLSYVVEAKLSGKHTPKAVIGAMMPELRKEFQALPAETVLQIAQKAAKENWLLAHSTDPEVQRAIERLGLHGRVSEPDTADYLAVVSANVGGNKSDRYLREELHLTQLVTLDRQVTDSLTISRRHLWDATNELAFAVLAEKFGSPHIPLPLLKDILGAGENHSYTEVFVPLGSQLLAIDGVPIEAVKTREEAGKTVFAFRFPKVAAGRQESVSLRYLLPQPLAADGKLDLFFESQPGRDGVAVTREILPEEPLRVDTPTASQLLYADASFSATVTDEGTRD